jgi:hypothetical protein
LSIIHQQDTHTSLPQQCFNSPYIDNHFFSLISASLLCHSVGTWWCGMWLSNQSVQSFA